MRNILAFVVLTVFATGCVSKSAHNKEIHQLEKELQSSSKDRGQLKASLEETRRALAEMQKREEEQKKRLKEFNDLTQRLKSFIDAGTLSVRIVDGKMIVSLGSDVLFPSGSAKLSEKGLQTIDDVNAQLVSIADKKYQVEGHTDNVPIKSASFPSNWELASSRALSVTKTMITSGMPADRVSAASFGDTHPIAPNDSVENKALNRRIEIVIVPDLSSLPGYEELQQYSADSQPKEMSKEAGPAEKSQVKSPAKEIPAKKTSN